MLILGLFILLLVSAISQERINGIIINRAAALVLLYSFFLSIDTLNVSIIGSGIGVFGGLYQITVVSKIVECFIYLLGAMILSNTMLVTRDGINASTGTTRKEKEGLSLKSEYSIIALFTVVGGILLITSNDLVSMYLSIELQSFGLYVLATIYRDSQAATYAGLKYFLLGGLSSGFILLGSSIIYAYTGVTNLESIYLLISSSTETASASILSWSPTELFVSGCAQKDLGSFSTQSSSLDSVWDRAMSLKNKDGLRVQLFIEIGLLVMTVGFLFKVASAPFHNWAPDVYDGVPTKVTTWLAIMAKISILTFLLDLVIGFGLAGQSEAFSSLSGETTEAISASLSSTTIMLVAAVLSLLVGTIVGLAQSRIKRLLAYSTISHVGFLLLAIAINTEDSIESFIFYLIQYSLTSANAFFVLIAFGSLSLSLSGDKRLSLDERSNPVNNERDHTAEGEYSPVQFISQLRGQFNAGNKGASSLLALAMATILFSMAGIPPLVGFFAKQAVLLSAVKNGFIFLALVGIVTSVISAAYYLRVIKVMVFDKGPFLSKEDKNSKLVGASSNGRTAGEERAALNLSSLPCYPIFSQENNKNDNKLEEIKNPLELLLQKSYNGEMSNSLSFSIAILTVLTVFFVLKPSLILNSAHIMALSLFYL